MAPKPRNGGETTQLKQKKPLYNKADSARYPGPRPSCQRTPAQQPPTIALETGSKFVKSLDGTQICSKLRLNVLNVIQAKDRTMMTTNQTGRMTIGATTLQTLTRAILGASGLTPLHAAPATQGVTAPPATSHYGRRRRRRMRR